MTDRDGTVHRFWTIDDPAAHAAVAEALRERWILIADGHHRYETALAYRDERRAEGAGAGPHDRVLMGLTALDDDGLVVLPTHRLLTRWPEGADRGVPLPARRGARRRCCPRWPRRPRTPPPWGCCCPPARAC